MVKKHPHATVNSLPIKKLEAKQRAFIESCAGQAKQFEQQKFVIEQIEQSVLSYADDIAMVYDDQQWSYRKLNSQANYLANQLISHGIEKGRLVPILTSNVPLLVVSILALMKIEAPFVIFDRKWPAARTTKLLDKISAKQLICALDEASSVAVVGDIQVITADLNEIGDASFELDYQRSSIKSDDPLYGFFTSGTTGLPKCCINQQIGLVNRFNNMSHHLELRADETVLVNSNLTFDSALWQIIWPLTQGARIVLPTNEQRQDVRLTLALIDRYQVTMTDFVPSIFRLLVQLLPKPSVISQLRSARYIIIGGEKVNSSSIQSFYQHVHNVVLMNTYGPTEASIGMMFYKIPKGIEDISLGQPIYNTYSVIVDKNDQLCPPGMMGEIVIGGLCLGSGYFNDSEKTDEAFIDNPFSFIPGDKLYRTGDLGYLRLDGNFQFVTRINDCVKINGVMVNLPEIEETIKEHPQVDDACVVVNEDNSFKSIVAFIINQDGEQKFALVRANLDSYLKSQLPANALPKQLIFKSSFPLSPNGKVDKKSLTAELAVNISKNFDCDTKQTLFKVIAETLNFSEFSESSNLLDLGMDSLAMQVISVRLENEFNKKLPISLLILMPSVELLADYFKGKIDPDTLSSSPLIESDKNLLDDISKPIKQPKGVLLTGVTGFVGAHLAAQLAQDLSCEESLFVLIREKKDASAPERLRQTFAQYKLDEALLGRIQVIEGDISQPRFGCGPSELARIFSHIDRVVLNAAQVNFLAGYDQLRQTNVMSIVHLTELIQQFGQKDIIYLSSLAVFNSITNDGKPISESIHADEILQPRGGYAQTKWVAESLLQRLRQFGVNVSIVRLGEIMPAENTGADNQSSFFSMLIKLAVGLGSMMRTQAKVAYTPVDHAACVLSKMIRCENRDHSYKNYHFFQPQAVALEQVIESVARHQNKPLQFIERSHFEQLLEKVECPKLAEIKNKVLAVLEPFEERDPLKHYFSDSAEIFMQHHFKHWICDEKNWAQHDDQVVRNYAKIMELS
ncbi:amino acid adenylation domain-containing protein [Enterovibrio norvegicus]|uniref:amino acid adenylation domain-containing protein n=1 Tax=Enterovibrio norvegicus TaxID=188144 RepID=UPI0024B0D588|nr:amino acid adenylation domain-containing protein [Enterovibrio norvegicus]